MPIKDQRLQIRMSVEEMASVKKRADAVGLTVAEYARKLMLAGPTPEAPPSLLSELQPEYITDRSMTIPLSRNITENGETAFRSDEQIEPCDVKDVPPGVRCIKCGELHGS